MVRATLLVLWVGACARDEVVVAVENRRSTAVTVTLDWEGESTRFGAIPPGVERHRRVPYAAESQPSLTVRDGHGLVISAYPEPAPPPDARWHLAITPDGTIDAATATR